MEETKKARILHRGTFKQIPIYLGKFFRMFIFKNDWLVLPMSALIAWLVAYVVGAYMFKTMEGTLMGSMALTCVCLWNGCFNSIQVVCRERGIVKREHRSGMRISAYILSHMIYQAFLCLLQTVITITICSLTTMEFPKEGFITPWLLLDFGITIFLTTYAADMMSLMISSIVKDTTSAMTVMPLVLIFELVFSGILFTLDANAARFSVFTIAKWGMIAMCALGNYNSLPLVQIWNQLVQYRGYEIESVKPLESLVYWIQDNNLVNDFCLEVGSLSQNVEYARTVGNVFRCWGVLIAFALVFAIISVLILKGVDKDKR